LKTRAIVPGTVDPADPRIVHATGHGRNGIALTPVTAATVVAILLGRSAPAAAGAASPARFTRV
jgi:glycine oxidase